jgi:UPF0716 family protein affecting phage T7 exclusion
MSRQLKLILFVLVFNAIGFAEGYLLSDMGLEWVIAILIATAYGAVLLSRRLLWSPRSYRGLKSHRSGNCSSLDLSRSSSRLAARSFVFS